MSYYFLETEGLLYVVMGHQHRKHRKHRYFTFDVDVFDINVFVSMFGNRCVCSLSSLIGHI